MVNRNAAGRILLLLMLVAPVACISGCSIIPGLGKPKEAAAKLPDEVDPFQLRLGVEQVIDKSMAAIVANASDIAVRTEDRLIRENTVRWKIRANDAFQAVLLESDARAAFIHGWTVAVQLRKTLVDGIGKDDFGEFQDSAIQTIKGVEADFVARGKESFPAYAMDAAADDIEALGAGLSVAALTGELKPTVKGTGSDIVGILKVPLTPLTALGAVGDTPSAINRFTEAARGIGAIMKQLPTKTRWQMELLLLETESSGVLARVLHAAEDVQETMDRAVEMVRALPAEVRAEFEQSLAAIRETQPELTAMLNETRNTLAELKSTLQQANSTIGEARKLMSDLDEPADNIVKVTQEFQKSAQEVRGLIADWDAYTSKNAAKEKREDAITIRDYTQMAAEMREAAAQVRGLLADLDQPLAEKRSLADTVATMKGVINMAFWRAVILVVIILIAAILYRFATRGIARKGAKNQR